MQPIDADAELAVRLRASEWNVLMRIIDFSMVEPHHVVHPIFQKIGTQLHTEASRVAEDYPRMSETGSKAHERDDTA